MREGEPTGTEPREDFVRQLVSPAEKIAGSRSGGRGAHGPFGQPIRWPRSVPSARKKSAATGTGSCWPWRYLRRSCCSCSSISTTRDEVKTEGIDWKSKRMDEATRRHGRSRRSAAANSTRGLPTRFAHHDHGSGPHTSSSASQSPPDDRHGRSGGRGPVRRPGTRFSHREDAKPGTISAQTFSPVGAPAARAFVSSLPTPAGDFRFALLCPT